MIAVAQVQNIAGRRSMAGRLLGGRRGLDRHAGDETGAMWRRLEHDRFRLTRGLPPLSLAPIVIARSGPTKHLRRSAGLLRYARDDNEADRVNLKRSCSVVRDEPPAVGAAALQQGSAMTEWLTRQTTHVHFDPIDLEASDHHVRLGEAGRKSRIHLRWP
jgi:hypothetical protein